MSTKEFLLTVLVVVLCVLAGLMFLVETPLYTASGQ